MKKFSLFIAFAMLAALTMVSCNNKPKEPTAEEIQAQKQALADSVLAEIDAFTNEYITASENSFNIHGFELTEKEKKIKPDYLLDPSEANNFVTKTQKINALAIYLLELVVRDLYDMPLDEAKEAITKLAMEVNHPIDINKYDVNTPPSVYIKQEFEKCKENGDVAYFWQFQSAMVYETSYLLAKNPELFYSKISEEQWKNFCKRKAARRSAIDELAKYDEEVATILEFRKNTGRVTKSDKERDAKNSSVESAKQFTIAHKDYYINKRNALLQ